MSRRLAAHAHAEQVPALQAVDVGRGWCRDERSPSIIIAAGHVQAFCLSTQARISAPCLAGIRVAGIQPDARPNRMAGGGVGPSRVVRLAVARVLHEGEVAHLPPFGAHVPPKRRVPRQRLAALVLFQSVLAEGQMNPDGQRVAVGARAQPRLERDLRITHTVHEEKAVASLGPLDVLARSAYSPRCSFSFPKATLTRSGGTAMAKDSASSAEPSARPASRSEGPAAEGQIRGIAALFWDSRGSENREPLCGSPPSRRGAMAALPQGWVACTDPTHGREYYFNLHDQCSTWDLPTSPSLDQPQPVESGAIPPREARRSGSAESASMHDAASHGEPPESAVSSAAHAAAGVRAGCASTSGSASPPAPATDTTPEPPDEHEMVSQLRAMGFPRNGSRRAALSVAYESVNLAIEWVLTHQHEPDFDEPLPGDTPARLHTPSRLGRESPAASQCNSSDAPNEYDNAPSGHENARSDRDYVSIDRDHPRSHRIYWEDNASYDRDNPPSYDTYQGNLTSDRDHPPSHRDYRDNGPGNSLPTDRDHPPSDHDPFATSEWEGEALSVIAGGVSPPPPPADFAQWPGEIWGEGGAGRAPAGIVLGEGGQGCAGSAPTASVLGEASGTQTLREARGSAPSTGVDAPGTEGAANARSVDATAAAANADAPGVANAAFPGAADAAAAATPGASSAYAAAAPAPTGASLSDGLKDGRYGGGVCGGGHMGNEDVAGDNRSMVNAAAGHQSIDTAAGGDPFLGSGGAGGDLSMDSGWFVDYSREHAAIYFCNSALDVTTWEAPTPAIQAMGADMLQVHPTPLPPLPLSQSPYSNTFTPPSFVAHHMHYIAACHSPPPPLTLSTPAPCAGLRHSHSLPPCFPPLSRFRPPSRPAPGGMARCLLNSAPAPVLLLTPYLTFLLGSSGMDRGILNRASAAILLQPSGGRDRLGGADARIRSAGACFTRGMGSRAVRWRNTGRGGSRWRNTGSGRGRRRNTGRGAGARARRINGRASGAR